MFPNFLQRAGQAVATVSLLTAICQSVEAQTPSSQLDIREQLLQQQRSQQQQQQPSPPDVRLPTGNAIPTARYSHDEQPCFTVNELVLSGKQAGEFQWALSAVDTDDQGREDILRGRCLGTQGINLLLNRVQNAILVRGFVTTRVLVQPQNLATGKLALTLIPGRIKQIRYAQPQSARAQVANALPMAAGDLLNLRDIEQGLENLKRVPTAEADIRIEPASGQSAGPGESDLVIQWQQANPFRFSLGIDDGGSKSTGRYQGNATLSYDHMFTLNDLFYVTHSHDLGGGIEGERGSQSYAWHYSLPFGYWLLGYSGSRSQYHQEVSGANQSYLYSGKSDGNELKLSRLLLRNAVHKFSVSLKGWERSSNNNIDDTEIEVQRRSTAGWELGLAHRGFIGQSTLDLNLNYRRGTGARGAIAAPESSFGEGSSRPRLYLADAQLNVPFALRAQRLRYNLAWRAQWNRNPLVPQDRFAIGSRYTVRGYNGENQLSAERGWLVRNDLGWELAGQAFYLGYDYGRISGASANQQIGTHLHGATLGWRGQWRALQYDLFASRAIDRPEGLQNPDVVLGFNLNASF